MQEVQDACTRENPGLAAHCKNAPKEKTHVTVLVAHVTEPQLETAKAIIGEILQNKILPQLRDKQFKLSFEGMSSFGEKIVYAEVEEGVNELRLMNEAFLEAFEAAGFDCDSRYTPHMTVMKVTIEIILGFKYILTTLYFREDTQTLASRETHSSSFVRKFLESNLSLAFSCCP